jgi:long-subunit acyl-CoA synthetase (AMP-forming)
MHATTSAAAAEARIIERLSGASTLCELFQATAAERADEVALRTPGGGAEITWAQYAARMQAIAGGLAALGVVRGEAVALMMTNRPEFALVDCAAMHLGATPFSVYNTQPADVIHHLLDNAGCRVAVCEQAFLERVTAAAQGTAVEHVVCVDGEAPGALSLAALEQQPAPEGFDFQDAWRAVRGEDVLTLIYTSGTTGPPKGVEITHDNLLAELRGMAGVLGVTPGGRMVSFLPPAHIADRWASQYTGFAHGLTVTYVADATQLAPALLDARPTAWGAVPRIWEKFKAAIEARIAGEQDAVRREAVEQAIATGIRMVQCRQAGEPVPEELAAAHAAVEPVLGGLRASLGLDQAKWIVVGAAPAPREVLEFFAGIGLDLLEVWGMSELSCAATCVPPEAPRLGSVGKAIPGAEIVLADDDEVLVRGPLVMRGYRREPEKTAETIDAEGWLHTGDIGRFDDDGYLYIVDRKKELIINAAGKNMSPANIESRLKVSHPLIGQAICIGDRRPYNVALLVLDPDAAAAWARAHGLEGIPPAALADREDVRAEIATAVEEANTHLARVEQIKRFHLLHDEWLPGGEELTPTMKLKRKPIAEKYAEVIEQLYA